jgi:hypothetical protein
MYVPLRDRLGRVVHLYEDACRAGGVPTDRLEERPLLSDADLDRLEAEIGRLLPEEARELFLWHDGSPNVNLVPDLSFNPFWVYRAGYPAVRGDRWLHVTNAHRDDINWAALFTVLNQNKMQFMVLTSVLPDSSSAIRWSTKSRRLRATMVTFGSISALN